MISWFQNGFVFENQQKNKDLVNILQTYSKFLILLVKLKIYITNLKRKLKTSQNIHFLTDLQKWTYFRMVKSFNVWKRIAKNYASKQRIRYLDLGIANRDILHKNLPKSGYLIRFLFAFFSPFFSKSKWFNDSKMWSFSKISRKIKF